MKPEYVIRENKEFKLIKNTKNRKLTTLIKQEYPYILQSMKYDKYKIEYMEFDIVQELIYENKVVGIMSIEHVDSINTLCINEVYIMPEYRHNGLFYETLTNMLSQANLNVSLRNPNRLIIDLLLKYNYAKRLKNNLIVSYIDFLVDDSKIYSNKQIRTENSYEYTINELVPTSYYDLNINSAVFMEITNLEDFTKNRIYIAKARLTDSKNKNYFQTLKNVDNIYLENLKKRLVSQNDETIEFFQKVYERLDENLDINKILGTEQELTEVYIEQLKEHDLTIEDGFIIRSKVLKALQNDEIIPRSIILRTIYLIENYNNNIIVPENKHLSEYALEECPYCSRKNIQTNEVCSECGQKLRNYDEGNLTEFLADKFLFDKVPRQYILKEELNYNQNELTNVIREELSYTKIDEEEVYKIQSLLSTYQFLKNIDDIIYLEVYNYDVVNNIREGSAFKFAKYNNLIRELKNYCNYLKILEELYPENKLKEILNEHNLDSNGEKEELLKTIEINVNPKDIFGNKYELTEEGRSFLKNKDYIENYLENLSEFTFYEYLQFYEENKEKPYKQLNMEFFNYMKEISIATGNYYKYHDTIRHIINTTKNLSQEEYLVLFTQLFIIDINYWIISKNHRKNNKPLSRTVMDEYPEIKRLYSASDIDVVFNKAMNSIEINYLQENHELIRFYFNKSLEYEDIDDINREIEYYIFKEEYLKIYSL